MYTWGEYKSGANDICSTLHDCLHRPRRLVERRGYIKLDLFADSCPGQNKNASVLCMLIQYINSPNNYFLK